MYVASWSSNRWGPGSPYLKYTCCVISKPVNLRICVQVEVPIYEFDLSKMKFSLGCVYLAYRASVCSLLGYCIIIYTYVSHKCIEFEVRQVDFD